MIEKISRNVFITVFIVAAAASVIGTAAGDIYVIEIEDMITAGSNTLVGEGLRNAQLGGYDVVVITLNTPGGILDATLEIVEKMEAFPNPIVTFVSPRGGIAASAGSLILLTGDVAAMTEATTTGAATPISMGLTGVGTAENKTIKFFAAHMRSVAEENGRNGDIAERFVTESLSLTSDQALDNGVIEYVVEDMRDLLSRLDGLEVEKNGRVFTLNTEGSSVIYHKPSFRVSFESVLSNPQLSFILFLIGIFGLIYGFSNPGTYVPETIGAIALILALFGFGLFDFNVTGIILIVVGIILLIGELLTPTFGILTMAGLIAIILGALTFPSEPLLPPAWFSSFRYTVFGMAAVTALFFVFGLTAVFKIRKKRAVHDDLVGRVIKLDEDIDKKGLIHLRGELWEVELKEETAEKGDLIEVTGRNGLTLNARVLPPEANNKKD